MAGANNPNTSSSDDQALSLDPRAHRAAIGAHLLELEPRGFATLALLCSEPGRVFDKDALLTSVWRGRVVTDAALAQTVAKLRRALAAAGGNPDWIRTVHGVGYAWDGPLRFPDAASTPPVEPTRLRRSVWPAVLSLLALLPALLLWLDAHREPRGRPLRVALLPFDVATDTSDLDWGRLALPELVADALAARTDVGTVSAHRVEGSLRRIGLDPASTDAEKARALRDLFAVDYVLFAGLERDARRLRLRYRMVDADGAAIVGAAQGDGAGALASAAAAAMAQDLDIAYAAGIPVRRISPDEFSNEAFARGLQALLSGRSTEARDFFQTALKADPAAHWTRYELGNAEQQLQHWEQAAAAYGAALDQALASGDRNLAGACRSGLGILAWRAGRLDSAEDWFLQARADFEAANNRANLAAAIGNLGILADNRGDVDLALAHYQRALTLYRAESERAGESAVYTNLAVIERRRGRLSEAAGHQERAIALQQRAGLAQMQVFSHNHLATIARLRGHFAAAQRLLEHAMDLARQQDDRLGLADAGLGQALLAADLDHHEEATRLARDSVAAYERLQNPVGEAHARMLLTELLTDAEPEQAAVQHARGRQLADTSDNAELRLRAQLLDARYDPEQLPAALSMAQTSSEAGALAEAVWLQARHLGDADLWQRAFELAQTSRLPRLLAKIAEDRLLRAGAELSASERERLQAASDSWRKAEGEPAPDTAMTDTPM